jgi:hypothetical protein
VNHLDQTISRYYPLVVWLFETSIASYSEWPSPYTVRNFSREFQTKILYCLFLENENKI